MAEEGTPTAGEEAPAGAARTVEVVEEADTITEVGAATAATMTGTTPGIGTAEATTRTTIIARRGTTTTGTRVGKTRAPAEDTTSGTIRTIRITGTVARRIANGPVRTTRHREVAAVTIVLAEMAAAEITTAATEARPAAAIMTTRRRRPTTSATTATAEPEMITTRRRRRVERVEAIGSITAAVAGAAEVAESVTRAGTRWVRRARWDRRGSRVVADRAR